MLAIKDKFDGSKTTKHTLGSDKLGKPEEISYVDRSLVTQSFTSAALDFIKQAETDEKPFYVNLWPDDVHSPFFPPAARRGDGTKRKLYHGVLDTMDEQLGVLFDYVRNSKTLSDNTMILVCSDNGPEQGAGSAGPFRGHKTHLFEGGIRSSLIVWSASGVSSKAVGTVDKDSVFSAIDLVPSLLKIAGIDDKPKSGFDGEALPDVLLGKQSGGRIKPLYFRRPPDRDKFYGVEDCPDLAIRTGQWKLLCEYDGSDAMLYDLKNDPGETKNLASKNPKLVKELTEQLTKWHLSMPQDNGDSYVPKKRKKNKQPRK